MSVSASDDVKKTLAGPTVHKTWEQSYYGGGADAFYERAFDEIVRRLAAPPGATILDAGCGQGYHSIRLARRGYNVVAADFSPAVLDTARSNVERQGLTSFIRLQNENLLDLSFEDGTFRYALCWGVLMHIPQVDKAIGELARVLQPGGVVVIGENNHRSLDAVGTRLLRRALSKPTKCVPAPFGVEMWKSTPAGPLLIRQAAIGPLIREFERNGLELAHRQAGEFTEAYTKIDIPRVAKTIHAFNLFWYSRVRFGQLASGNILFFRKRA